LQNFSGIVQQGFSCEIYDVATLAIIEKRKISPNLATVWSRKNEESCSIFATCWNLLPKYGDFRKTIPQNLVTLVLLFSQKSFVLAALDPFYLQIVKIHKRKNDVAQVSQDL
jgi:hypothetical protein